MQIDPDSVQMIPGHEWSRGGTLWQSCDYVANGVHLFHERTCLPWSPFKPLTVSQWFDGLAPLAEIEALAAKHGGRAVANFYPADDAAPLYFLAFDDTDKALAFVQTDDFDALCLTLAKIA